MFAIGDTVVYKGHGLVKVVAMPETTKLSGAGDGVEVKEHYYVLKSARTPLVATKLMVKVEGAEKVLRYPLSEEEAKKLIEVAAEEAAELPEDHMERMRIMDEIVDRNDVRELAALMRDYRESKLLNLDRVEIKRIKAVARNIAEELCHVLKINRVALKGKFSIRSV
jgi:RNA polymerase-interacting CarD/CdnL/TRCF family regulator